MAINIDTGFHAASEGRAEPLRVVDLPHLPGRIVTQPGLKMR
jgi:hypothetical protein